MQRAHWDDDVSVLSAENVFFEIETAGLAARFGAALLDMTLQLFAIMLVSLLSMLLTTYISPFENWATWMLYLGGAVYLLLVFLIGYAYYFFFEWLWDGQTPGKRLLRLRVMQSNGMPITYWHAFVRNVIRIADFLPVMYGVGATVALLDSSNRRAGDLLAGTIVARERGDLAERKVLDIHTAVENFLKAGAPLVVESETNKPATVEATSNAAQPEEEIEPEVDAEAVALLTRLNAQDYELARDFLMRRDKLPAAARLRLAQSLAARLAAKLGESTPADADAEPFLQEIVERLRGKV